jgi:hypothetical protein
MELKSIRAKETFGEVAVLFLDGKLEHEAISINHANTLARQQAEVIAQRTVAHLFHSL